MLTMAVIPAALTFHGMWQLAHQPDEIAVIATTNGLVVTGAF